MSKAWKLFIVNVLFFGLFLVVFLYETTMPTTALQYFDFSVVFLPAFLFYIIFYGCFSFVFTKKIIMPNVQLFLFVVVFFYGGMLIPFHFLSSSLSKVKETWMLFATIMGVSLGVSLLTKGIYHFINKIKTVYK